MTHFYHRSAIFVQSPRSSVASHGGDLRAAVAKLHQCPGALYEQIFFSFLVFPMAFAMFCFSGAAKS